MFRKVIIFYLLACFVLSGMVFPQPIAAQELLPTPGQMVHLSPAFNPAILRGIKVHPDQPFKFEFILDQGDNSGTSPELDRGTSPNLRQEANKLIKYFLASLTTPEKDLWVNLSPYEKDRIVPDSFGQTEMGRDLLAQDYMLKQITASLIYPEDEIGRKFWKRIYEEAAKKYGNTNIPVNTFNKVWIVPEKAVVYENSKNGTAYIVESHLKVMLEQDYLSLQRNTVILNEVKDLKVPLDSSVAALPQNDINTLGSQIIREVVIPELTREVNQGKNFAKLRQVYNSLILATWYKKKIKDSILNQVYSNQNKIKGVGYDHPVITNEVKDHKASLDSSSSTQNDAEGIYQQYLQAFKKGVYNYIREEDGVIASPTGEAIFSDKLIPRKYFSGGFKLNLATLTTTDHLPNSAMSTRSLRLDVNINPAQEQVGRSQAMMTVKEEFEQIFIATKLIQHGGRLDYTRDLSAMFGFFGWAYLVAEYKKPIDDLFDRIQSINSRYFDIASRIEAIRRVASWNNSWDQKKSKVYQLKAELRQLYIDQQLFFNELSTYASRIDIEKVKQAILSGQYKDVLKSKSKLLRVCQKHIDINLPVLIDFLSENDRVENESVDLNKFLHD